MLNFEEIALDRVDEVEYNNFSDKLIFQTKEWLCFIKDTQNVKPIILKITENGDLIGYFTGFLFSKFGIKIVGSPFRGWTTLYMGINLVDGKETYSRGELAVHIWKYLKKIYRCVYFEMIDRYVTDEEAIQNKLRFEHQGSYIIDLSGTEEELLAGFTKHCRKHIKQFERKEAEILIAQPDDSFAEEYYEQLKKVFGYQNLTPSYDLQRVKMILKHLKEKNMVLCLRAVAPDGTCIGTSISFGFNGRCYTWGSTSIRAGTDYLQSEGLRWHMMKYWRERECYDYDMVGIREYKLKFNPTEIQIPRLIFTSFVPLIWGRNLAQKLYWVLNSVKGKMKKKYVCNTIQEDNK